MQAIPEYRRRKIVEAVDAGDSVADVAERFAISETTVRNFLRLRQETGSLRPQPPTGGPRRKLTELERERLLQAVDKQPDATLAELIEQGELDVSESTVSRELQRLDRPRKRKVPRASEQDEPKVQKQRAAWAARTADVDPERFVFVDETGISTNMTRPYGRAASGETVFTEVPYRGYKTLTVLGGMRLGGEDRLPTLVYEKGTTVERMLEYITGPLRGVLRPHDIVVADRLNSHKANAVAEALAEQDAEIWLLPSYSPDLNPIERLWSKVKVHLRAAKARTVERLQDAVANALDAITNNDIQNWLAHSDYLELENA